jgi:hypothetical protein
VVIWRYRVAAVKREAFELIYGPNGPWTELFSESPDYADTELLRGENGVYLTIDRWTSADAYDNFLTLHRAEYARIDEDCAQLTEEETLVGRFEEA